MIRTLLATTALASFIATGAFAQTATPPTEQPAAAATGTGVTAGTDAMPKVAADGEYLQTLRPDQYLVSDLTGETVYQSTAADAASAGEINNFLVGADGKIVAAIVDTGSYLETAKTVAVPFDKLTWTAEADGGETRAVLTVTREELMAAPGFMETLATADGAMAPAAGTIATDTTAATSENSAMQTAPAASSATNGYMATVASDQYLSQDIIGAKIYGGTGSDAATIGSVNDLVVDANGMVSAGIVGVGGFLGLGEKNVGVTFADLQLSKADGAEPRVVLAATKEQLTQAPKFEDDADEVAANADASGTTLAQQGAATGAAAGAAVGSAAESASTAMGQAEDATRTAIGNAADSTAAAVNNATTSAGNAMESAGNAMENTADDAGNMANNAATTGAAATGAVVGTTTDTTASTGGSNDRAAMTPVAATELSAENVVGTTVYGPNDDSIGEVGDIALSPSGTVDAVIVDVGGFLGLGEKQVAVAMDNLQFMRNASGSLYLYTQFTEDQLKSAPEYQKDSYAQNRDTMRIQTGTAPAQ